MFQLSLVTSLVAMRFGDTAAVTELQYTNRLTQSSFAAASKAFIAPAIEGVITSFGSDDSVVTDATWTTPTQCCITTSNAPCVAILVT